MLVPIVMYIEGLEMFFSILEPRAPDACEVLNISKCQGYSGETLIRAFVGARIFSKPQSQRGEGGGLRKYFFGEGA